MLAAARARLRGVENVEIRSGDLEELPIEDRELDAAVLLLVLHYLVDPAKALSEAWRVLKPGGRLLVMDMTPHARDEYRQTMGHVWQGFDAEQIGAWATEAGFERVRYRSLPPDAQAKGPGLFAATMRRPPATRTRG
jgi:ArsR family transcriptional regulator